MLSINSNMMASNAARHLSSSYDALAQSVERLSSGLRINSAKDDAAGLAVSQQMAADLVTTQQGVRNAQDGQSMLQTMEGALQTVNNDLVRMKQLAEQASTGSYSTDQRTIMNNEFQEMARAIDNIAASTTFNGITMLNNSASVSIVFGGKSDTISVTGSNMTSSALGVSTLSVGSTASAQAALTHLDTAIGDVNTARSTFGYKMNRLESTVDVLNIAAENLSTAESRVTDVDVATEMATMTKNQVLAQAGISMLAQANSMPQMALKLLG
ncbi:MAG: flagellin [Sedimentisphaerales bacterium]|jgi:flagellin